jgi:hypothetical protein
MILKGFKEKSIKKKLNTILNSARNSNKDYAIKTVGVIFNIEEIENYDMFKHLSTGLNILPNKIKVIAYTNKEKDAEFSWNSCFHNKDIGWHGKISNVELNSFLYANFDLLISYYQEDILELKFLTASSNAKFKASIFQGDERLNDLIINSKLNEFHVFEKELIKYLQVLNKIKNE